jgi:hypothetical protein
VKKYWRYTVIGLLSIPFLVWIAQPFLSDKMNTFGEFRTWLLGAGINLLFYFVYWAIAYSLTREICIDSRNRKGLPSAILKAIALCIWGYVGFFICMYIVSFIEDEDHRSLTRLRKTNYLLSNSFSAHYRHSPAPITQFNHFKQKLFYFRETQTAHIESNIPTAKINCAKPQWRCLQLHNGSTLAYELAETLTPSQPTSVIRVILSPQSLPASDELSLWEQLFSQKHSQSIALYLTAHGRLYTDATLPPNAHSNFRPYPRHPDRVPDWAKGWEPQPLNASAPSSAFQPDGANR